MTLLFFVDPWILLSVPHIGRGSKPQDSRNGFANITYYVWRVFSVHSVLYFWPNGMFDVNEYTYIDCNTRNIYIYIVENQSNQKDEHLNPTKKTYIWKSIQQKSYIFTSSYIYSKQDNYDLSNIYNLFARSSANSVPRRCVGELRWVIHVFVHSVLQNLGMSQQIWRKRDMNNKTTGWKEAYRFLDSTSTVESSNVPWSSTRLHHKRDEC